MVSRGIEAISIDHQVPIAAQLNRFSAEADQALDVKLVRRNAKILAKSLWDSLCLKDDNFPSLRRAEIIGDPIDEQMIPVDDLHANDLVSLFVRSAKSES